jgi:hypothetical protein
MPAMAVLKPTPLGLYSVFDMYLNQNVQIDSTGFHSVSAMKLFYKLIRLFPAKISLYL